MVNENIYGTDIHRDWQFSDGDLEIITGDANLGQAIVNRLNADDDWYSQFYTRYGGRLYEHFGDLNHSTIHEYFQIEIESIVSQDPRIAEVECTVNKIETDTVECSLKVRSKSSNAVMRVSLVLNGNTPVTLQGLTTEYEDRS